MTSLVEVDDKYGLYATISSASLSRSGMRRQVHRLGQQLAEAVYGLCLDRTVLCVVILRGGALLYPSFADRFLEADYCMIGLRRSEQGIEFEYCTQIPRNSYDRVVYLDCVAGTGNTLLAAHEAIGRRSRASGHLAAVICSATPATRSLAARGVSLVGFSLAEEETGGIVAPDLGRMDAGDLFAGEDPDVAV